MRAFQKYLLLLLFTCTLFACHNNGKNLPLPTGYEYTAPVTQALEFSPAKKLTWAVKGTGNITPIIKPFDLSKLSYTAYDSNPGRPLIQADTIKITQLTETQLKGGDSIKPLILKTSILPTPELTTTVPPVLKAGLHHAVYNFAAGQGYAGQVTGAILKDHNGHIWIAGDAGIYRYDGRYTRHFSTGLANDVPVSLVEDRYHRIWSLSAYGIVMLDLAKNTISLSNQFRTPFNNISPSFIRHNGHLVFANIVQNGFIIVDPANLTYRHISHNNGLTGQFVSQVTEDSAANLWVATEEEVQILTPSGKIRHLPQPVSTLKNNSFGPITCDNEGFVWTINRGILRKINLQDNTIIQYTAVALPENGFAFQILKDKKQQLWIATTFGLLKIDIRNRVFRHFTTKDGLDNNVVIALLADNDDKLWVATNRGVDIIENEASKVFPIIGTNISAAFQAPDGKVWIGEFGTGIDIIDRQNNRQYKLTKANGIGSDSIQSFQKHGDNIWITNNQGLDIIDTRKNTILHIGQQEGLANRIVYSALKASNGEIWLAGPTGGLDVLDTSLHSIKHIGVQQGLSDNSVVDIKADTKGMLWVATTDGGVSVIDPVQQTIKHIINVAALKGRSNKLLFCDQYNRIWMATRSGICIADNANHKITTVTTAQGLSSNYITSFNAWQNSVLVGTNTKVNIVTPPTDSLQPWKIQSLNHSHNLVKETTSWATDLVTQNGEFWWCDSKVAIINKIEPLKDSAQTNITGITIMNQPQFFTSKAAVIKDTLWDNDTFYINNQLPPFEAKARQQNIRWDSISGPYNMPQNLRIPYNLNYLMFQFAQTNTATRDTAWYTYMLEGIDKQWSARTHKTASENYLNLPPGSYTFKVKSKRAGENWTGAPDLQFIITPPWWQTWWFYTVLALLFIGSIRGYIIFRSGKLKKENKLLEEGIRQRTAELQKSLDDLKATQSLLVQSEKMASLGELTAGIAHEIQNPLNFVNNFAEVNKELIVELKEEIDKGNYEDAKLIADDIESNEGKINHHGKRADAIVKSMLQHSRSSSGKKELTDINALADEYLRLSYHGLRAKDKSFNASFKTNFDTSINKLNLVQQDIGRVLLNLINNAFYAVNERKKAVGSSFEPVVLVTTKKLESPSGSTTVLIAVTDNGNGIPDTIKDKIFQPFFTTKPTGQGTGLGLSLSYDIVTKGHGGELKVESEEGKGTTFTVELPEG